MKLHELVKKNRSCRRFKGDRAIEVSVLRGLVDLARFAPSAANLQPLRYLLSADPARNMLIFPHLYWAAYLKDWDGPRQGERPSAYIVMLSDSGISGKVKWDHGIAAQTILLGAVEQGLAGCMIAGLNREGLRGALSIPEKYGIEMVIALGVPEETIVLEDVGPEGNIRYWRGPDGEHHVPKRSLDDLILDI